MDLAYTSPPLKRHEICQDFGNVRMKISFRNKKNIDIFSSFLMAKHAEIKNLPPPYRIPSTVPDVIPHFTDDIPRMYWCYFPIALNNLNSAEGIPHSPEAISHMFCCVPHSTEGTEQPPMYWTSSTVLNRCHMGWLRLFPEELSKEIRSLV